VLKTDNKFGNSILRAFSGSELDVMEGGASFGESKEKKSGQKKKAYVYKKCY
jgi:hypothetical protein